MPVDELALDIQPATAERWPDLERLFGARGACGGCWCMVWRLPRADFEAGKGAGNRATLQALVESGAEPGLLAYQADEPVGWCAVAPRAAYPALARSRILKPLDNLPVWSVSCLFVARPWRRRGVTVALLRAAVAHAARNGAQCVEGYPVEPTTPDAPPVFVWTGLASAFRAAGFSEVARRSPTRPIMRATLEAASDVSG